jgi:hypothetical protein
MPGGHRLRLFEIFCVKTGQSERIQFVIGPCHKNQPLWFFHRRLTNNGIMPYFCYFPAVSFMTIQHIKCNSWLKLGMVVKYVDSDGNMCEVWDSKPRIGAEK